jgi:hypothetical protein
VEKYKMTKGKKKISCEVENERYQKQRQRKRREKIVLSIRDIAAPTELSPKRSEVR